MSGFQLYLFRNALRALSSFVGGLALIALVTQGLSQTQIDLIVENHQSLFTYIWITLLATPQIVSILLPIAVFVAVAGALNNAHRDNEIVVAQASGLSNWGIAAPVIRLAALAAIAHLAINLWVQPAAYRELRRSIAGASSDLATSLVKAGAFITQANGLTIFAREVNGSELRGLLVSDARDPKGVTDYIAKTGVLAQQEGAPVIIMRSGLIQQLNEDRSLQTLKFEQSPFDLAPFVGDEKSVILKESDRFLPELFHPDLTNFYDYKNVGKLRAEGHARLAAPLLDIAMAMIALLSVLGGSFSRRGYSLRIGFGFAGAILLRLLAFSATSFSGDNRSLNFVQYVVPVLAILIVSWLFLLRPRRSRGRTRRAPPASRSVMVGGV